MNFDYGDPATWGPALEGVDRVFFIPKNGVPEANAAFMAGLFEPVRAGYAAAISPAVEQVLGRAPTRLERFARDYAHMWI